MIISEILFRFNNLDISQPTVHLLIMSGRKLTSSIEVVDTHHRPPLVHDTEGGFTD